MNLDKARTMKWGSYLRCGSNEIKTDGEQRYRGEKKGRQTILGLPNKASTSTELERDTVVN